MGGKIQIKESDKIVFFGNTIDGNVDFRLQDSSALIKDNVSVRLSGESCVDSKSLVDGELCDFEIEEVSEISMNSTQSPTEMNLTGTSSPTSVPITDDPNTPVMDTPTDSPTSSPTVSPMGVEAIESVESENTDAVSGSSKLSFGLKELTIPIICLFFIK